MIHAMVDGTIEVADIMIFIFITRWNDWGDKQNRSIQCRINVSHQENKRK